MQRGSMEKCKKCKKPKVFFESFVKNAEKPKVLQHFSKLTFPVEYYVTGFDIIRGVSCPTSPPGGNLVDGLPPVRHNTRASSVWPWLGRGQICGKRVLKLQFLGA